MHYENSKISGTLLLVGGIQFILFLIIAEAVYPGYSVSVNYISDLGVWGKPSAVFFNPSTVLFGLAVLASSYFINKEFKNPVFTALFALAGLGALGVGVFPENTFIVNGIPVIHTISAGTAFIVGGLAALASFKFTKPPLKYIGVILGAAALVATVLFRTTKDFGYLGLGVGGMERMIAYPTILWIIGFGGYQLGKNDR
jgi:hypothetical membrane protein